MKNKRNKKVLTGSPYEQGRQLIKGVTNHEITFADVKDTINITKEFIQGVIDCVKQETENNDKRNDAVIKAITGVIDALKGIISDGKIDSEERKICYDALERLCDILTKFQDKENERSHQTKRFFGWMALLAFLAFFGKIWEYIWGRGKKNPSINTHNPYI